MSDNEVRWGWVDDVTWCCYEDGDPTTSRIKLCGGEDEAREAVALDPWARVLIRAEGAAVAEVRGGRP